MPSSTKEVARSGGKSIQTFDTATDSRFTLWYAARRGNIDRVQSLIQRQEQRSATIHGYIDKREPESGATALQIAATGGHVDVVAYLIEKLADVNLKDPEGNTALHLAAAWGNISTVRKLLEFGADKTALNNKQATPLQAAFEAGRLNISEELGRWEQFAATEVERNQRQADINGARCQSQIDADGEADGIYLQLQSLAMKERELGADHIGLQHTLEKLARVYREQSPPRFADAVAVLRRLALVTEKEHGPCHMETAKVLNNVGEAIQAAAMYHQHQGSGSSSSGSFSTGGDGGGGGADAVISPSASSSSSFSLAAAVPLFERALDIVMKCQGPNHVVLTDLLTD
jgi:hypothetical protein